MILSSLKTQTKSYQPSGKNISRIYLEIMDKLSKEIINGQLGIKQGQLVEEEFDAVLTKKK